MKRIAAGLAVVVLGVGGFYLLISGLVSSDKARTQMTNILAAWTGRHVSVSERVDLRLFPSPHLTLYDLRIAGPDGDTSQDFLSAEVLDADIRILPLIIGRLGFRTLELSKPRINILRNLAGQENWQFDGSSAALQLALTGDLPMERLAVKDAVVEYRDIGRGDHEIVTISELSLDWKGLRQPAELWGTLFARETDFSFDLRLANPLSLFDRKSSPVNLSLEGGLVTARLQGELTDYKAAKFTGNLDATGSSLRQFIAFLGGRVPSGPGLGPFTVRGSAEVSAEGLFVDQGAVELDGNEATGSMRVRMTESKNLEGTLAFQSLDMTPYLALLGGSGSGQWSRRRIDTNWFADLDADLRLSADRILIGPYELGQTAASAFLKEKRLEIGLAESTFYGGTISGTISVTDLQGKTGQNVALQLRAADFDLESAAGQAGAAGIISGTASMAVDMIAEGADLGDLAGNVHGRFSAVCTNGTVSDFGLARAWQALSARNGLDGVVQGSLSTYQKLDVSGELHARQIALNDMLLVSGEYIARLAGVFRIAEATISLKGFLADKERPDAGAPLAIEGPITAPALTLRP